MAEPSSNIDESAQQAQNSAQDSMKRVANTVSQPLKKIGRNIGKRAGKAIRKAAFKAIKLFIKALIKLLIALGPWVAAILIFLIIVAAAFDFEKDERGSTSSLTLDPAYENPTTMTEEGYLKADAMTEQQALIDAYYKYLACDSFQKVFIDDSGTIHRYKFSNVEQTADFAGLTDLYNKENFFYLSSYFLKMTDELFNNEDFYYPEQFIKPVYSDILPLKDPEPDEAGKKFVTTLPLVDDGSENAKILLSHLLPDEADLDGPYAAAGTSTSAGEGEGGEGTEGEGSGTAGGIESLPKRKIPDDATKVLIAPSKLYEYSDITMTDPNTGETKTFNTLVDQGDTDTLGIWDYGFGSVLQYEPMTKDQSMNISKIAFTYHYHILPWTAGPVDADGNTTHVYPDDFDPDTMCKEETYEIILGAESSTSVLNTIKLHLESLEETADDGSSGKDVKLIACPTAADLSHMLGSLNVEMRISPEDEALAGIYYDDAALQKAFGNAQKSPTSDVWLKATKYPLKIPVISAAATFSGNLRYKYEMSTITNDLMDETGSSASIGGCWDEDCSIIEYATFTCGEGEDAIDNTCAVLRAGTITSTQPSAMADEVSAPMGFQYVEDYGNHYQVFVPNQVRVDTDFRKRVYNKQEGADALDDTRKASYDADGDGEVTVMDFLIKMGLLTPYAGGVLGETGGITQGEVSASEEQLMAEMGCGMDEEGQVRLLAKVIAAEAGPNKLDQLLVGAVVVNRIYSSYFAPTTIIGVITADGQYASWSNGSIRAREPTQEQLSSARQILNGEFAVPSNIVFQAGFRQGDATWLTNINGPGYVTHFYCSKGSPDTVDIFGRTALTEAQARDLAESLHQQDIANGYTGGGSSGGTGGSGIAASPEGSTTLFEDGMWNGQKLYASQGFNLQKALGTMRQISNRENSTFLDTIYALRDAISNIIEQISKFFSITKNLFGTEKDFVGLYAADIALADIHDTVIQAVTFSSQDLYSNVAEEFDPEVLQFLFVGEGSWAGAAQGTTGFGGGAMVPGTGSTLTGFGSPTSTHYSASTPWSAATGSATIAIPAGTPVLAVGDVKVDSVEEKDGTYSATMTGTSDGKTLMIIYENLASVNVSAGSSLSKGDTVGIAGEGGVIMKLYVDGVNTDPMKYFYQPTFGSGASFYNVLDENGLIDQAKVNELSALINSANVRPSGPYDKWHNPSFNSRSVGQCTWWAWGRGYQYCEENNSMPSGTFGANGGTGYGNGVDYYSQAAEDFAVGKIAAPNSWISWAWTSPDNKGNWYGHVAFVEAVGADGTILISDCGSNIWNNGPGIRLKTVRNSGTATNPNYYLGEKYRFVGFVYLSQPK